MCNKKTTRNVCGGLFYKSHRKRSCEIIEVGRKTDASCEQAVDKNVSVRKGIWESMRREGGGRGGGPAGDVPVPVVAGRAPGVERPVVVVDVCGETGGRVSGLTGGGGVRGAMAFGPTTLRDAHGAPFDLKKTADDGCEPAHGVSGVVFRAEFDANRGTRPRAAGCHSTTVPTPSRPQHAANPHPDPHTLLPQR